MGHPGGVGRPRQALYNYSTRSGRRQQPSHTLALGFWRSRTLSLSPHLTSAANTYVILPPGHTMKKISDYRLSFSKGGGSGSLSDSGEYDKNFVPPKYLGLSGSRLSAAIGLAAGAGFLMFGYDQGVMGSLFTLPSFRHRFDQINTTDHTELRYAVMQGRTSNLLLTKCFFDSPLH